MKDDYLLLVQPSDQLMFKLRYMAQMYGTGRACHRSGLASMTRRRGYLLPSALRLQLPCLYGDFQSASIHSQSFPHLHQTTSKMNQTRSLFCVFAVAIVLLFGAFNQWQPSTDPV